MRPAAIVGTADAGNARCHEGPADVRLQRSTNKGAQLRAIEKYVGRRQRC